MEIKDINCVVITADELSSNNYRPTRHDLVFLLWILFLKDEHPKDVWDYTHFNPVIGSNEIKVLYRGEAIFTASVSKEEYDVFRLSLIHAIEIGAYPSWCDISDKNPIVNKRINKPLKYYLIYIVVVLGIGITILELI